MIGPIIEYVAEAVVDAGLAKLLRVAWRGVRFAGRIIFLSDWREGPGRAPSRPRADDTD